jgi:hypothetical protein
MTPADETILAQQDLATLARWYCELNSWEWPEGLPDPEPAEFAPGGRRGTIMDWIFEAIGHRAISHHWNVIRSGMFQMTEDEFNNFWRGHYEGHAPSLERHRADQRDQIKRIWPDTVKP